MHTRRPGHLGELRAGLARLPRVGGGGRGQRVQGGRQPGDPRGERTVAGQVGECRPEPVDELGEAAEPVDVARLHVVERQRRAQPAVALHRDTEQQPVQPRGPRVLREPVEPVGAAVRGRQPPPDPGTRDEVAQPLQVVAVQAETAADRARGEQVEHLGRREPGVDELQQAPGDVEHRVHLPQRTVREPDRQPVAGVAVTLGIEPERRRHQRSEGLDVRAGDEDVTRLQGGVGGEQAEHDLAEHLDLAVRAVAGVHGDRAVVRGEHVVARGRPVVAHVALQALQQRHRRAVRAGVVRVDAGEARQPQLQFPDVPAERGEQRMARELGGGIGAARGHAHGQRRDAVPQGGRGVRQPQVHVAMAGEGREHGQVVRGQAGGAEQRQPLRQGAARGVVLQHGDRRGQPLRAVRDADPRAQGPPQLRLPAQVRGHVRVVARAPGVEQLGPVGGVGVEQPGDVRDHREPAARPLQMSGQGSAPRPARAGVDDLQERPHRPGGVPGVVVGGHPRGALDGGGHHLAGGGEGDVRAHAVAPPRRRAEPVRQAVREPALHPARRHRDDLGGERVRRRLGDEVGQRVGQGVRALGPVQVQHGVTDRPRRHGVSPAPRRAGRGVRRGAGADLPRRAT